jgi:hypothetical protein
VTRHGVRTRLQAGRWRRQAGRPHWDPDSRGYHFAWYHKAALAERSGGTRGDQADPWPGRERSPPSPVRSGHQDWPTLQGSDQVARGRLRAPELRQPEDGRNSPFRAAEGALPGFRALAAGPTLNLRPEWLSNPRGTPQRTPGGTLGHGQQDARADQLDAPRPRGWNAPREEDSPALRDEREPAPARLRFEEGDWGDSPKLQAPPKLEGSTSSTLCTHKCPEGYRRQLRKNRAVVRALQSPIPGPKGDQRASASTSLDRHHARRLPLTRRRVPLGMRDQRRRAPRSSHGHLDRRQ